MLELIIIISLAIIFFIFLGRMPEVEKIEGRRVSELKNFFVRLINSAKKIKFKRIKLKDIPRFSGPAPQKVEETKDIQFEAEKKLKFGDLEGAEKLYLRLAIVSPQHAKIYAALGRIYLERLNYKDAVSSFKAAVNRDRKNGFYYFDLATALFKAERYSEAVICFEKSILINNCIATRHFSLGLGLMKIGEDERAADSFRRAYEIEPNNEKYKRFLKKIEAKISSKSLN